MSYEFNPQTQTYEFPNPYKVENLSLFLAGAIMLAGGIWLLLQVRADLASGSARVFAALALGVVLIVASLIAIARGLTQLRFFFGRNRPENLSSAGALKETLRANALEYPEPAGPLNGLLYSILPGLMFAPSVVRHAAERQFHNFASLAVTLACFLASWFVFGGGTANVWIGLFFAGFVAYQILRPMASAEGSRVGIGGLVLLLVIAIVGPVAIGLIQKRLPDLGDWSVNAPLLVSLTCALLATFCFGMALKAQLQGAPQAVGSARVIETLSINAHPGKLMEELDRTLMAQWFQQIPNRRYAHAEPVVEGQSGSFSAELLEETQPRPRERSTAKDVADAFGTPEFRWLALLSALFVLLTALGTLATLRFVDNLLHARDLSTSVGYSISLLTVAFFCWRAAHVLWGRFDFVSEVTWVELQGSFESARLNMGNQFSDKMQSSKSVINIEAMTLRVWASELDSVIFGKDAGRQVIGMRSLPERAQSLSAALKKFGEERSMVVAPSSQEDMLRAARLGAVNRVVGLGEQAGSAEKMPGRAPVSLNAAAGLDAGGESGAGAALICRACKRQVLAHAAFCSGCGARLT